VVVGSSNWGKRKLSSFFANTFVESYFIDHISAFWSMKFYLYLSTCLVSQWVYQNYSEPHCELVKTIFCSIYKITVTHYDFVKLVYKHALKTHSYINRKNLKLICTATK
jgi:hypothetical protein